MKLVLDIIIYVFSILGGIVSITSLYRFVSIPKKVKWKDVEKGVVCVKDKLIRDNYLPTLIVGMGRGGSIVGALLSGCLGHIPIMVIDHVYDWKEDGRHDRLLEEIKLNKNLEKVLLVDGELHTGGTAKAYQNYFNSLGALEIKIYAFLKEKYSNLPPDYYTIESDNPDLCLPWMLTKDYKRASKIKC